MCLVIYDEFEELEPVRSIEINNNTGGIIVL